jgi:acetyl esterase
MRKLQLLASAFALAAVAPQAAIAAGPVLDPSVQKFVDGLAGGKPIYDVSPADARKVLVGLQSVPEVMPAVQTEDRVLPLGPKGSTKIRVIRPKGVTGTLPVNVYFHGAGWVMGDTQTHDRLVRELSAVRGDGDGSALGNWLVSMAAAAFVCAIAADAMGGCSCIHGGK